MVPKPKVIYSEITTSIRYHCIGFIYTAFVMLRIADQGCNELLQKAKIYEI